MALIFQKSETFFSRAQVHSIYKINDTNSGVIFNKAIHSIRLIICTLTLAGRAAEPPSGRPEGPQKAKSGLSGIGVPEDLFGFCSPPLTNKYYVKSFTPGCLQSGRDRAGSGNPHNCSGSGFRGTCRVHSGFRVAPGVNR